MCYICRVCGPLALIDQTSILSAPRLNKLGGSTPSAVVVPIRVFRLAGSEHFKLGRFRLAQECELVSGPAVCSGAKLAGCVVQLE